MKINLIYLMLLPLLSCNNSNKSLDEKSLKEYKIKIDSTSFANEGGLIFSIKISNQELYALTEEAILKIDTLVKVQKEKYSLPANNNIADFSMQESVNGMSIYLSSMDSVLLCNESLGLKKAYKGNQYFIQNEKYLILNYLDSNSIAVINLKKKHTRAIKNDRLMLGVIYNDLLYNVNEDKTIRVYDLVFNKPPTLISLKDTSLSFIAALCVKNKYIGIIDINDEKIYYKIFSNDGSLLQKIFIPISVNDMSPSLSDYNPSLIEAIQKLIVFNGSKNSFYIMVPNKTKNNKLYKIKVY